MMLIVFKNLIRKTAVLSLVLGLILALSASQALAVVIPATGAVNKQGTRLYIPDQAGDRIRVQPIPSGSVTDYNIGANPMDMVLSPDGRYLYVSVSGSPDYLKVYDLGTSGTSFTELGAPGLELPASASPKGIGITPDGETVYIADSYLGRVHIINVSNPSSPVYVSGFNDGGRLIVNNLHGIAIKPDGTRLYISRRHDTEGKVFVYDITNPSSPSYITEMSCVSPTYLKVSNDGTKLFVRVKETSGDYYDVRIYNTNDNAFFRGVKAVSPSKTSEENDPNNTHEGMNLSPHGWFLYFSKYRTSGLDVRSYAHSISDNDTWQMSDGHTSKDFMVPVPDGRTIYLTYSNGGGYETVTGSVTGVDPVNGIPTAPIITYPLPGDTGVQADATWLAATDDGQLTGLTYLIQIIEASQINTNNWVDATFTTSLSIPLSSLNLQSNTTYYMRIRAYDGTQAGTPSSPGDFSDGNFGPYAYTGPFTTGDIIYGPRVDWVYPDNGDIADLPTSVEVHGEYFGDTQGASTITFGGVSATVTGWSSTLISAEVPSGLPVGPAAIVVTVDGQPSNDDVYFTVLNGTNPVISELDPDSGYPDDLITIRGYFFGDTQGGSTVSFGGLSPSILFWSDNEIVARVPSLSTGTHSVYVTVGGIDSNSLNFEILGPGPGTRPQISYLDPNKGVSPDTGPTATTVDIHGERFGVTEGAVTFLSPAGRIDATVSSWTDTLITVTVPSNAITGRVLVVEGGETSNGLTFTVLIVPTDLDVPSVGDTYAYPSWYSSPGADFYTISYGTDANAENIGTVTTTETWVRLEGLASETQYYVKVRAETSVGEYTYYTTPVSFTTTLPTAPTVLSIIPDSGTNDGPISVTITGTNFQTGATAKLWRVGELDVTDGGTAVVVDPNTITCTFDLLGAAPGLWNVTVINPDLQEGTLFDGFTVVAAPYIILSPVSGNQGQSLTLYIQGYNTHFALDTIVSFDIPDGITITSGPTIDIPNQRITLDINIDVSAPTGARTVNVDTPSYPESVSGTFTVNPQGTVPVIGIDHYEDAEVIWNPGFPDHGYYDFAGGAGINIYEVQSSVFWPMDPTRSMRVQYSYDVGGPGYDGWGGAFAAGTIDIGTSPIVNGIRYRILGDDSNNTYHMEIVTADEFGASVYRSPDLTIPTSVLGWVEVTIPYSQFTKLSGPGAATFDLEPFKTIKVYQFVYNGGFATANSHYIDAIEATDVVAPTAVVLYLTKVGDTAKLDWTASTGHLGYRLYHANNPAGPWTVIYEGSNQTFTHTDPPPGPFIGPEDHYYYVVGYDAVTESPRSNVASIVKTTFNFVPGGANKFWLSIPYNNPYITADGFLASAPLSVTEVSRFDPTTQSWITRTRAGGGTNFTLVKGEGLQIVINSNTDILIYGTHDAAFTHNLTNLTYPGRHLVSVPYDGAFVNAQNIVDDINGGPVPGTCIKIVRLNPNTQNSESYRWIVPVNIWFGTNFNFVPGEAYEITINNVTNWQPTVY